MTGTLFLIPTPLAADTAQSILSPQIKDIILNTNYFFVENLRTSRRLISELKLGIKIEELNFYLLDKDTPDNEIEIYIRIFENGNNVGLMSEAGCPGIADPGSKAIKMAHKKGIKVVPLAGPSSIFMALMASGFNGQSFTFCGYLPIDKIERVKAIKQLEKEASEKNQTQIFMETPFRNNQIMQDLLLNCRGETLISIACDVSSPDEFVKTQSVDKWRKSVPDLHKKPTIFCLYRK